MKRTLITLLTAALLAAPAFADLATKDEKVAGTDLRYRVITPKDYDPAKEYPAVLAFPGGAQSMPMVDGVVARNWRLEAEKRGYIVVVPAAPAEGLFFQGGSKVFPAFIEKLLKDYKVRGGKFFIAGVSNGGVSAFYVASHYPKYFISVTGFPGYLPEATDAHVAALKGMCIHMYAGEKDSGWVSTESDQAKVFRSKGYKVTFSVEQGEGHVMRTLEGDKAARLFDNFEQDVKGCQ